MTLEFPVAGIGSRFVAVLLDHLIIVGGFFALFLVFFAFAAAAGRHALESLAGKWFLAGLIFVSFLLIWCYFALFEAFWHGQTPGKRAMQLRVIKDAGRQVTLFESLARNLLRVVDYLPSLYLTGVIAMLCNQRNKRLGDMAAGTIVVHERRDAQPLLYTGVATASHTGLFSRPVQGTEPWQMAPGVGGMLAPDALARLSSHDLVVIEAFFARALDLPLDTRAAMAHRIVREMTAKMGVPAPEGNPERALEAMAVGLRGQGRRI